jgi:hypothetical protein
MCLPHSKSETEGGTENDSRRNQHKKRQHSYRKIEAAGRHQVLLRRQISIRRLGDEKVDRASDQPPDSAAATNPKEHRAYYNRDLFQHDYALTITARDEIVAVAGLPSSV